MTNRTILRFPVANLLALLDHTEAAPEQCPFFEDLVDPALRLPGAVPDEHGMVEADQIDRSQLKPALAFVKDRGAYLMSQGLPGLMAKAGEHQVVYAEGFGEGYDYGELVAACGGDDFAERIYAAELRKYIAEGATYIGIRVNEDTFEIFSL